MAITKMRAIEYNAWMSLISMIESRIRPLATEYGMNYLSNIKVLPSYPRDLSTFKKPSIIVQKVNTDQSVMCFGGYIGQYYDSDVRSYLDVHGIEHEMTIQLNIEGDTNTQRSLITSIITDNIINPIKLHEVDDGLIHIYDYVNDHNSQTLMGYGKFGNDIDIYDFNGNINNDYVTTMRFDVIINQVIVPSNQQLVDLSKWVKIKQKVKL